MKTKTEKHELDVETFLPYNKPGPRYTSYPTAVEFDESFDDRAFSQALQNESGTSSRPLSLYVHLPFCPNLCYFCGCHSLITRDRSRIDRYLDYLKREMNLFVEQIDPDRPVSQIHWGGGTPSYLSPEQIQTLMDALRNRFSIRADAEIGAEVDPRGCTEDHLEALRESGFNRISMGIQDFHPQVQEAINRIQSEEDVRTLVEQCRTMGFESINMDLMYGLPHQTPETFDNTLSSVIELNPDRLAVYSYAHVPWKKPHQKAIPEEELPEPKTKLQLFLNTIRTLTRNGYEYIGMDHFAKPDDDLTIAQKNGTLQRNFQGYFTHSGSDLLGFGISGISTLENVYAQNIKDEKSYFERIDEGRLATFRGYRLTGDDPLRRTVIMELMCNLSLQKSKVEERYDIQFDRYFQEERTKLSPFRKDGLLEESENELRVTDRGRLVIRNICMVFDRYLDTRVVDERFSNTI